MNKIKCVLNTWTLGVLALVLPGVAALSDRVPIIASAAVALFLLLILIVVIVFASCFAETWIKGSMKRDGKVKMPRSYFEKKREVKRRLLAESTASSRMASNRYTSHPSKPTPAPVLNGSVPVTVPVMDKVPERETLVEGWNQDNRRIYEEKGYTMELGDENEDEFHIETTLVDNEVLDVGPYKNMMSSSARPVEGNVYNNPYIYTNNDRVTVTRSSDETGVVSASSNGMPMPAHVVSGPSSFDNSVIKL